MHMRGGDAPHNLVTARTTAEELGPGQWHGTYRSACRANRREEEEKKKKKKNEADLAYSAVLVYPLDLFGSSGSPPNIHLRQGPPQQKRGRILSIMDNVLPLLRRL